METLAVAPRKAETTLWSRPEQSTLASATRRPADSSDRSTTTSVAKQWRLGTAPRVLIVDDDAATRLLCSANLQLEGLRVLEATDGRHGLAQAIAERPDLILTDVSMPDLDGFQLAEALRGDERTRLIPLIFLSGEISTANAARARGLGALAYVTKPFDPLGLASLIAGALIHHRRVELPAT